MPRPRKNSGSKTSNGATVGYEAQLWQMADALEEVGRHGHDLTPGRYAGADAREDDGEPFEEKMKRLTARWREQQAEAVNLDRLIKANLEELGYGI